jgi:putative FmdB family regulatory protein
MPTYSYSCCKCNQDFELFFYIKDYIENPKCIHCGNKKTNRSLAKDVMTLNSSVVKSDGELKTIGDLANRNRDRFSDDQKQGLFDKHNSYKEHKEEKPLPKGMSRIKKKGKVKWTQS